MKTRTNLTGKFKEKKGYSKINLLSRKQKDTHALSTAEKSDKPSIVFIKSKEKIHNPDTKSDIKKARRGDAIYVTPKKRKDGLIEADYKYAKNLARKKK